jgi:hypothetical protein
MSFEKGRTKVNRETVPSSDAEKAKLKQVLAQELSQLARAANAESLAKDGGKVKSTTSQDILARLEADFEASLRQSKGDASNQVLV